MRTPLLLALAGILLGVVIALGAHQLQSSGVQGAEPCTAQWLGLAPTIAIDPHGRRATVGLGTKNGGCVVRHGAPRELRIRVRSAHNDVLVDRSEQRGLPPGAPVDTRLTYYVSVPAPPLCKAPQPLVFEVWVAGVHAAGQQSLRLDGGRCTIAS